MATEDRIVISDLPLLPEKRFSWDRGFSAALRSLEVGQNVLLPTSRYSACALAGKAIGVGKYACRTESDGIRIWRRS